jgi:AcrR family transcriptional regulator/predicted DNA-binding transcriptional regulator AlpA
VTTSADDLDELINAEEVASLLGLAHRNSVSTYRSRYPDFPPGQPAPGGGRSRLWVRGEVIAWHERFRARQDRAAVRPTERLDSLVEATERLLLAKPGRDVSIREIAEEAGVAHSDLYRHAESKEVLVDLAIERIEHMLRARIPDTTAELRTALPSIVTSVRGIRPAILVLAERACRGVPTSRQEPLPVNRLADTITRDRAERGAQSPVDARVLASAMTGMLMGLLIFQERWQVNLELQEIPDDQVAAILDAMLTI